jgi:hypothetical protein
MKKNKAAASEANQYGNNGNKAAQSTKPQRKQRDNRRAD